MSIDAPAAQIENEGNNQPGFNYIDTYVEFIAEVVLKFNNAIPESKNRQQKELQQHKQFQVAVDEKLINEHQIFCEEELTILPQHASDKYAYQFVKEINPPPPKA